MRRRFPDVIVPAQWLRALFRDDYATAAGHVILQWSMLEGLIEGACWQAARVRNDIGRVTTSQLQMQSKLDLLGALLMQTRPILGEQFNKIAGYVRDCLLGQRNLVAHGFWVMDAALPHAAVTKFRAKGQLVAQSRIFSLPELEQLADDIADVASWVLWLSDALPKLKQRSGGLGHMSPVPPDPQVCANRKMQVLQPPVVRRKASPREAPGNLRKRRSRT